MAEPRQPAAAIGREPGLMDAFRYVVHIESLNALAVIALLVSVLEWLGTLPWSAPQAAFPIARMLPLVYVYLVMRKAAGGSKRLPVFSDFRDTWDALIHPLLQLLSLSCWFLTGTLLLAHFRIGLPALLQAHQARMVELCHYTSPACFPLLGGGLLQLPPSLVAATIKPQLLPLLDPSYGLRVVAAVPGAYRRTFGWVCVLTMALFVADACSKVVQAATPIPIAAPVMGHMLGLWVLLCMARLLGNFSHHHGQTLRERINKTGGAVKKETRRRP